MVSIDHFRRGLPAQMDRAAVGGRIAGLYPSTTCRAADIFYGRAGPVALPWETQCLRTRSI
jgi:hypothetical protein